MKKIILTLLATLIFSTQTSAFVRDGLYIGAGVGRSSDQAELTSVFLPTEFKMGNEGNDTNYLGNVFLGFGSILPNAFFLAGEIGANFPGRNTTLSTRPVFALPGYSAKESVKTTDYITFDVLPGYSLLQNLLLYGRLGFSNGELQLSQPQVSYLPNIKYSNNVWGGRFGVGATVALDNNIGLNFDYYYATYQSLNFYSYPFNSHYIADTNSNVIILSLLYRIL